MPKPGIGMPPNRVLNNVVMMYDYQGKMEGKETCMQDS